MKVFSGYLHTQLVGPDTSLDLMIVKGSNFTNFIYISKFSTCGVICTVLEVYIFESHIIPCMY